VSKHLNEQITINLLVIKHYVDGEEYLFWDPLNNYHRIRGHDLMKETRHALCLE